LGSKSDNHSMEQEHAKNLYSIFGLLCHDESMSTWNNCWRFPGGIFVPSRKLHPFGNEYHSICCAATMIMYVIEINKGKNAPP
jgi:hypothetical protein